MQSVAEKTSVVYSHQLDAFSNDLQSRLETLQEIKAEVSGRISQSHMPDDAALSLFMAGEVEAMETAIKSFAEFRERVGV